MSSVLNLAFFEAVVIAERIREGSILPWRVQLIDFAGVFCSICQRLWQLCYREFLKICSALES